jgi:hypothetical protein
VRSLLQQFLASAAPSSMQAAGSARGLWDPLIDYVLSLEGFPAEGAPWSKGASRSLTLFRARAACGPAALDQAEVDRINRELDPTKRDSLRKAMRPRTSLDGKTLISATPRYLLVSAEEETEAERVLAMIQPNRAEDVNPFSGKLSLLVEPRLPEGTYYLFADPARLPCLQYAYHSAAQGVQIQRTEMWDTLGMKFRAYLDFGAGWLDWRGAHKVPGA